jgi:hypothetical protein
LPPCRTARSTNADVYRREFLGELTDEMRESFAERAAYLKLLAS